jgi:hypothetical protein
MLAVGVAGSWRRLRSEPDHAGVSHLLLAGLVDRTGRAVPGGAGFLQPGGAGAAAPSQAAVSFPCAVYSALIRSSHAAVQYVSWAGARRRPLKVLQ